MQATADGAWGLRFPDLRAAAHVLVDAPGWPVVDLEVHHLGDRHRDAGRSDPPGGDPVSDWDAAGMQVRLGTGGHLRIVWPLAVTLTVPGRPIPECLVQPHLSAAAASIALRRGRQPFHAGAFDHDGRAWAVLGPREAGKSTTLALAGRRGAVVVTDDLVVVDDGAVLAGPRCVDLRPEAAAALSMGTDLGTVGRRERWRVHLGSCPSTLPLAGFVLPSWGTDDVSHLPPVARLQVLFSHSALQGVTMNDPDQYLRLASLPMLSWSRPKSWSTATRSLDLLLTELTDAARPRRKATV